MTSNTITAGGTAIPSAVTELTPKTNAVPAAEANQRPLPQSNTAVAVPTSATSAPAPDGNPAAKEPDTNGSKANVTPQQQQLAKSLKREELNKAVDELNASYKSLRRTGLQFSVDDKADTLVVKVMDMDKDEVIRQIPAEDVLELAAFLKEQVAQRQDKNPWTALTERNQALNTLSEGWLVNDRV